MELLQVLWLVLQPVIGYIWCQHDRAQNKYYKFALMFLFITLFTWVGCISEKLFAPSLGELVAIMLSICHVYATGLWKLLFEDLI